jgi:hypothetical protein
VGFFVCESHPDQTREYHESLSVSPVIRWGFLFVL